jgi:hypothetical protein
MPAHTACMAHARQPHLRIIPPEIEATPETRALEPVYDLICEIAERIRREQHQTQQESSDKPQTER